MRKQTKRLKRLIAKLNLKDRDKLQKSSLEMRKDANKKASELEKNLEEFVKTLVTVMVKGTAIVRASVQVYLDLLQL
jgi:hypothetical protein